ncbi:hypothetical protein M885DRAFT_516518 [Pelagophyceae sp. CCMP2097]|nr:hypothetical protein M885DRAFT_516518 [Pelagophyceae sp. CCMP2097]
MGLSQTIAASALASTLAVVRLLFVVAVGGLARRFGRFDAAAAAAIAWLSIHVTLPCLCFTMIARAFRGAGNFGGAWPVLLAGPIHLALGRVVAAAFLRFNPRVGKQFGEDRVVAALVFKNSAYLPIALIPALVQLSSTFRNDGGATARAMGILGAYMAMYVPLEFNYCLRLLAPGKGAAVVRGTELLKKDPQRDAAREPLGDDVASPRGAARDLDDDVVSPFRSEQGGPVRRPEAADATRLARRLRGVAEAVAKHPVEASCAAGLAIAVTPLRAAFYGSKAPLATTVTAALEWLGGTVSPLVLLMLGANIAAVPADKAPAAPDRAATALLVATKLLLLPLVNGTAVLGLVRVGALRCNRLELLVLLTQGCMPPPMNLMLLSEHVGAGQREMAHILLATYVCSALSITAWSTAHLLVVDYYPQIT